jgi:hypothetical protein
MRLKGASQILVRGSHQLTSQFSGRRRAAPNSEGWKTPILRSKKGAVNGPGCWTRMGIPASGAERYEGRFQPIRTASARAWRKASASAGT